MWEKVWHRSIFLAVFMTIAIIMLLILSHNSTFSPSFYHFQQEQEKNFVFSKENIVIKKMFKTLKLSCANEISSKLECCAKKQMNDKYTIKSLPQQHNFMLKHLELFIILAYVRRFVCAIYAMSVFSVCCARFIGFLMKYQTLISAHKHKLSEASDVVDLKIG